MTPHEKKRLKKLDKLTDKALRDVDKTKDAKKDVIQTLNEAGYDKNDFFIRDKSPSYYHPGKSGSIYLDKDDIEPVAYFGEIHPNILKKTDIKTNNLIGFEIFLENFSQIFF